ncbi:MAG TPA: hypothetical protein PKB04_06095, partial [Phenylobacterium sp.]|nr:hypothetical protein [Phenylobacterium sp.]
AVTPLAACAAAAVVGAEAASAPTAWYSEVERAHDFVLYAAEGDDLGWRAVVVRQVDRLFRLGRAEAPPPGDIRLHPSQPLQAHQLVDLILVHPTGADRPRHGEAWNAAAGPARLFHLRRNEEADVVLSLVPGWGWHDFVAALRMLASPLLAGALLFAGACFARLVAWLR